MFEHVFDYSGRVTPTPLSTALSGLTHALAEVRAAVGAGSTPADLIDAVTALELHKRAAAAAQADLTAALSSAVTAVDTVRGTRARDRGCSVVPMIALARRESPHTGAKLVAMATALAHHMPHTLAALRAGRIDERTATAIAETTSALSPADRARVDGALRKEFTRDGAPGTVIVRSARALTCQVDPRTAEERARTAAAGRYVSLRPAPDAMTLLTALLPAQDGAAVHAALTRATNATAGADATDGRTRAQITADVLIARLTGQSPGGRTPRVVVNLVMTADALLAGGDEPAAIPGLGPVPARTARALIAAADQAWIRRLHTTPDSGTLIAMDSTRRRFPASLGEFLRLRDQRCATPHCGASIQHLDHITPHAAGGPTSADNGQGLCARCNYTKEQPGFTATRDPVTGVTTLTTPTGHRCSRTPPPPLGHPTLPVTVGSALERVVIEVLEWTHAA